MWQRNAIFVFYFVLVLSVSCFGLIRHTVNGPIDGILQTSSLGQKYFAFKGIPYAEPPITGIDYDGKFVDRRFKVRIEKHCNAFDSSDLISIS